MKRITRFILLVGLSICLFGCENDSGKYFDQFVEKNGNTYYYNSEGKKYEGWLEYGSNWFYFQPSSGKMSKNQWIENKYYLDEQGRMLISTTKEINGIKYSFDKKGVGEVWTKFKITLDKELPYLYEYKDKDTGKMYSAWQLTDFKYYIDENYATKNNDLTLTFTFKLLYSSDRFGRGAWANAIISLIDENGNPAKIETVSSMWQDWNTFEKIYIGCKMEHENDVITERYTFRDIADGQYKLIFEGEN